MSHEPESRQEASRNAAVLGLERELRERLGADDDLFGLIQGDLIDAVWICEPEDPELCWISDGFWRILGLDPAESATLSPLWRDLVHPDDLATVEANFAARRRDPATPYDHMARYRRKHGGWAWIRSRGRLVEAQGDRAARLIGAHMDVTAMVEIRRRLERAESAALQSENRLRSAIEAIPDGFVLYDADDRMVLCNQRYRELYAESAHAMRPGARFEDVIRAGLAAGQYPEAAGREDAWLEERLARHRLTESSVEQQLPGERYLKIEERRTPLGDTVGFRVDITELKRQQRRLEDYAHSLEAARSEIERRACHDDLTGLANRRRIDEHLAHLREALAESERGVAMLHIDLDRFRQINDTMGHAVGDRILLGAARLLAELSRPGDLTARIGADEFVLVRTFGSDPSEIETLAAAIVDAFAQPFEVDGRACRVGASVGVAFARGPDLDPAQLMIDADIALNRAKSSGRSRYEVFFPELQSAILTQRQVADELLQGLERSEFIPYYQPQFAAGSHDFIGVEALARWRHPTRGVLTPDHFLKAAEELDALADVDRAILEHAARDMNRLIARGLPAPKLSVNVTVERLRDPRLFSALDHLDLGGATLAFELLESIFLDGDDEDLLWRVEQIKQRGVEIEIDDFGSGRASILALTKIQPKRLKIDRQLIMPLADDSAQRPLVQAIIDIGRSLDVAITAEGVESAEHATILAEMGCTTLQGFHFARPLPFEALEILLRSEAWRAAA